jgi:hypothetical protein
VKEAVDQGRAPESLSFDRLLELGREALGRELALDRKEFERSLQLDEIVRSRGDCGPSPEAVSKAIAAQAKELDEIEQWASAESRRIADNWRSVEKRASQL